MRGDGYMPKPGFEVARTNLKKLTFGQIGLVNQNGVVYDKRRCGEKWGKVGDNPCFFSPVAPEVGDAIERAF
jgi:hypothetical protein